MTLAPDDNGGDDQSMADEQARTSDAPDALLFSGMATEALLATGRSIGIRPAQSLDVPAMRTFYDSLSDTAAYYRFLGLRPAMLDAEVQHSVDQSCRHICLLARLEDGRLIGIGEYSVSGPATAEVAIAVADDHHHEGVATLLLERLVEVARRCGLERFMARTMRGNEEMRHVLRTLGLRDHVEHDDGTVTYSLDLGSYDELQRQSTARLEQALRAASHLLRPQAADDGGS